MYISILLYSYNIIDHYWLNISKISKMSFDEDEWSVS